MKIGIASDHRGFNCKEEIIKYLKKSGHIVTDYGTSSNESVDYPKFAFNLCEDIKKIDLGILLCGTGIGMSIAANKVKGIRCARICTNSDAKYAKLHNNANVMAISCDLSLRKVKKIIKTFIETDFSNEERHIRRNNMVDNYDNKL